MNTMLKRIVSMFLCFVLVAGYLPAGALAAETEETVVTAAAEATNAPSVVELSDEATVVVEEEAAEAEENEEESLTADTGDPEEAVSEEAITSEEAPAEEETSDEVTSDEETSEEEITEEETSEEATEEAAAFVLEAAPVDVSLLDAPGDSVVVIAGSDYQNNGTDSKSNTQKILTAIQKDYATANGFIFGGDYSQTINKNPDTTKGINELKGVVEGIYDTGLNEVFVQGNHDAAVSALTATGAHDTDDYGVFSINEDDFSSSHSGSSVASTTMLTALETYLNEKVNAGYSKPVFVATHLPLHATSRGDNTSATKIFNLLNAAGASGLNIIFLFGHNHSGGYDAYLGNGSIYLPKGSNITVAGGSNSTLNFTYMNYGYVGYVGGNACTHLTMTTFEISDTQVIVKRYDANGEHTCGSTAKVLKAAGVASGSYTADTTVVNSGATITLTTPTGGSGDSGDDNTGTDTPTTPDTPASGNIYVLDTDGIDAGEEYLIVSTGSNGTGSALTNNSGTSNGTTVTISGGRIELDNANAVWVFSGSESGNAQNGTSGYYIYPSSTNGKDHVIRDETCALIFNHEGNGEYTIQRDSSTSPFYVSYDGNWTYSRSETSVYLFKRSGTGSGGGSTVTPEGGDWVTISSGVGGTIYTLTDTLEAGKEYLIVSANSGSGYALQNPGVSSGSVDMGATAVDIQSGTTAYITTDATDIVWTATDNGSVMKLINNNNYLEGKGGGVKIYSASQYSDRGWEYEGNQLKYTGGRNTYIVYYDNGYTDTYGSTSNKVYLFAKTGTEAGGDAEYAKLSENLTVTVSRGADRAAAEAAIKEVVDVLVAHAADYSDAEAILDSDENIIWTLASNYDGNTPGEYAVKIYYKEKLLGTAKVIVPEATIVGYSCDNAGAVNKGASKNAETGAYITVDVKDDEGADYRVPVTVGMLTDANGNKVSTSTVGTITDLYVNYNGQKFPFTLTINPREGNNYPNYPDPGAVKVNKTASGIDFQASGIATVELSASGIPMNEGVDVVIILDASSSMEGNNAKKFPAEDGTEMYRMELLRPAVNNLIEQLKTKREDGSNPDVDIAIATFNGNTLKSGSNYIGSTTSGTGTNYGVKTGDGTITGAWEDINTISATWATDNNNANTPAGSGTNYDYGLQLAYDLLAQKKADSNAERLQFVMFLSDGAPSQYNGVSSNDGVAEYVNWIRGNYNETDENTRNDIPDTVTEKNKAFYTGFNNNNGQLHRSAEAIKAAQGETRSILRFTTDSTGQLEEVDGLGATIYSIGLLLEDGSARTEEDQITVLKTIASDDSKFFNIDSVNDLRGAFTSFAQEVLLAATNARFEDQMGEMYDLQLTPVDYRPTGEATDYSTITPQIEVRSYEIYTRAELEADGTFSDEDAKKVGTRKTNTDGTYKYTTLETVTFQYSEEGTAPKKYTLTGATSDQLGSTNILSNGVVCAESFYYNTTSEAVTVDGITVGAETFYWKLGDIKTTELAIRYNVYLTGSLEGKREAGSYDTNESAVLYYNNYLGNACKKETVSPTLAWKGANVRYAFYLVDASSGKPVNNEGVEVPFAQRVVIVNPTECANINLNSSDAVESREIVAEHILPEGYWLYDESAMYKITVNGNGTGEWDITGDADLKNPNTTYVTDYDGNKYTYEDSNSEIHPEHDYTHTTVWFAVKWEPRAMADTVVVDYGLPVDVHVLTNDMFGKYGKLIGVAKGNITETASKTENSAAAVSDEGDFGTAEARVPATGYTEANSVVRYTMDDMQMTAPDVFTYSIQYANPVESKNDGFYYGTLTVIPATTIYYEDTFLDLASYTKNPDDGSWPKDENAELYGNDGKWEPVGIAVDATQDEDRPGDINFAFDTIIDANNVYGNDSAYETMSTYSLGSAAKVHVDSDSYATASFSFYGTGFDVISMTSNMTGTIVVKVTEVGDLNENGKENDVVKNTVVDTYYGMNADGSTEGAVNNPNALYQVPVIKIFDLPYGQYHVTITATYNTMLDHTEEAGYDLYLDAIRIYDPTGNENEIANDAYIADGEGWPIYEELRDNIIEASNYTVTENEDGTVTVTGADLSGAIFIDCNDANTSIADYVSYGPNNELYLANNQAIAFSVDVTKTMADVQLGIKAANGNTVTYKINGDSYTLNTATDMYYSIWDYVKDGEVVTIQNVSGGILSLTNIKSTFSAQTSTNGMLRMTARDAGTVLMSLRASDVEEEVPETTEPSVPETTEPEETKPAKPDNSELKAAVKEAKKLKSKGYTQASFKKLQTAIKAAEKVLKDKKATQAQIDKALADLNAAVDGLETVAVKPIGPKPGGSGGKIKNNFKALDSITDVFRNLLKGNKK